MEDNLDRRTHTLQAFASCAMQQEDESVPLLLLLSRQRPAGWDSGVSGTWPACSAISSAASITVKPSTSHSKSLCLRNEEASQGHPGQEVSGRELRTQVLSHYCVRKINEARGSVGTGGLSDAAVREG